MASSRLPIPVGTGLRSGDDIYCTYVTTLAEKRHFHGGLYNWFPEGLVPDGAPTIELCKITLPDDVETHIVTNNSRMR